MKGTVCINSVSSVTISVDVSSCLFHISLQIDKLLSHFLVLRTESSN